MMTMILNSPGGVALVTGLLSVIGVMVAEFMRRQHKAINEVKATTEASREQVENSHGTNLRDDLDRVLDGIAQIRGAMDTIYEDLAWERRERMDVSNRLENHIITCPVT